MEFVAFGGQCLIGVVFAMSALSKIRGRTARAEFVRATGALLTALLGHRTGPRTARWAAAVVVVAESAVPVLIAAQVLHPLASVVGSAAAAVLLGLFSVAIVRALRRGVRTSCRCFGTSQAPLGRRHLARNLGLLAVALTCGAALPQARSQAWSQAWSQPAGAAVAGGAALVLAVLVSRLDDLVELFVSPAAANAGPVPKDIPGA
ncbi:MauE/DoxX family redox-associated membrane protein [Nonomuraea sp. NPDC001636]|uniref:MauE/DoxX family redox-associated membrane protein n=1 Tax=Nonomuraea sp. NPDC001636 TaxID=3154391 RepID=UPI003334018E